MKKDFQSWHKEKSVLHEDKIRPFFHEREVWFASLGVNVGFEIDGKHEKFMRPVIVLRKFNNETLWGLPLTKNPKQGKYYFSFSLADREISTANLSQIRLIDSKRLQYKIGDMPEKDFTEVKEKLRQLLA
ncbi:MAG: hypothetical protein A3F53_02460 [Candidatus Zambryskibacteria bacterium RIFCSPHIGHO2_12_FULL_48_10]|uniref:Toxin-antitoxin system protein n=1 Tax=Candidatus Zambryskibacteria bacterium RIFCSPHIGHO2_01_FULL_46_25 TaxID=1802738 RepID=A0A1G2SY67_9BACT|nr:MAG: hypothetical protein A2838_01205 [Candidatus Zambryskibacteria bacterium RIFCSPHIGHO2_01_FULL_46_25]OHB02736.1 MAG: hypothetical protein A3F53_02460 [Candidatus Zambryskibacteria bacterium RIFCSPHIGHO2_12_FULL_48_10]OHB06742.1 MAG: hypothetical protein A3A31_00325 [Candidatus Zambryskibacteria bacterium RIFCSPLOWO2_01_FULL_48_25]